MQEVAAYLLCVLGGKGASAENVAAVISASGAEADSDKIAQLVADLEGKDVNELISTGMEKLKDVPMGGSGGGGGGAAAAGGEAAAAVEEEVEEEEEADMGGGGADMFGGDAGGGDY
mmetsp:Transcript_4155/g.3947  ORF Transcript_4155/g.3947 Transcript_4155/m.3947 type:complete len:117 (-) Transcript_4155:74-424(-)|eukprot:CAMPEP_0197840134 /NCGR_PEP_ID=MMETSP1437-20131217/45429_1 /TAXON_ID=49252 ORGANISM="Eucampia antarctica, Strain CCMP1452" /NCGR_SAMPLE_ID=MMETSP1437 /ASSEMBLY_ACC=CAM_ASM_001096 /LENGTH=116 /DNA_ID=CAMNT_0043449691 /DNA_START=499 /DNA_END=849 /DNA_ORIENTATION=-